MRPGSGSPLESCCRRASGRDQERRLVDEDLLRRVRGRLAVSTDEAVDCGDRKDRQERQQGFVLGSLPSKCSLSKRALILASTSSFSTGTFGTE